MKRFMVTAISLCFLTIFVISQAIAQDTGSSFKWGFRERIRNTYLNNLFTFDDTKDDETDMIRVRTNLWGKYTLNSHLSFFLQLTNEFRPYLIDPKDRDFTFDEIIIDNLYFDWTSGGENPISLRVGRQNLIYGEGFILLEGAPWDGSRAIYHDAIKLSIKRGSTTIDFLGISNTREEERLPVIRGEKLSNGELKGQPKDQPMNDGLEQALGVYAIHKCQTGARLDAYYIFKTEDPDPIIPVSPITDQLKLNTLGGRLAKPLNERFSLTTEWAYQFGTQGDFNQRSFGGYAYLSYLLQKQSKGAITGGLIYLSGDDPDTKDNEGWNPLFSRWPKWSELYIYSQIIETIDGAKKVAFWTNTFSPYIKYAVNLSKMINFSATYYHLNAIHGRYIGDHLSGTTRGDEIQLLFKFNINKFLTAHFLYDRFFPGDFYDGPRDSGSFIRGEVMYKF